MTRITTYLTFNGNCREAMAFYRDCLGGELQLQTVGESPMADAMPEQMKNAVLHATLSKDSFTLMGSDMACEDGLIRGNAVSLFLECNSETEIAVLYETLSEGGKKEFELQKTHWGDWFGTLNDRFGNHWLLHHNKSRGI